MADRTLPPCLLALLLLAELPCASAQDLHVTVGLKSWISTWTSWGVTQTTVDQVTYETITPLTSDTTVSFIPQVSLLYGRWLVAGSYTTPNNYKQGSVQPNVQPDAGLQNVVGGRSEWDATVGYYVTAQLAVLAGYKQLDRDFGGDLRWSGPIVGLSSSSALGFLGLSAYGTVFYGPLQLNIPADQAADADGRRSFDASYVLVEAGIAYTFKARYTVNLGYRAQTVRTSGYALSQTPAGGAGPSPYGSTDLEDTVQGPTLGVAASF